MIKGSAKVAKASSRIEQHNIKSWITIYYDYSTQTVMTEADYYKLSNTGRAYKLTQLIRPNTPEEVSNAVERFLHY